MFIYLVFSPEQFSAEEEDMELSTVLWPLHVLNPKVLFLIQILTVEAGSSFS